MEKKEEPSVLFGKSKWIWAADATKKNSNIILRRTFSFGQDRPPSRAVCRAACETHYYMFVNGNAVVWEGGLNRTAKSAYYDEFDIGKYLVKGDNVIVVHCSYFGNEGRDLVCAERAGFIFECNDLIYTATAVLPFTKTPRSKRRALPTVAMRVTTSITTRRSKVLFKTCSTPRSIFRSLLPRRSWTFIPTRS